MSGNQGEWLFERVQRQLRHDWKEKRKLYHNSKGDIFEKTLADFLTSYFGGVYEINTKVAVIDENLTSFDVFNFVNGDDEIDVVSTFSQAKPRVIFETGDDEEDLRWVPFEAVAFVCEVKSELTKQALKGDFEKLSAVSQVADTLDGRFGLTVGGEYTINDPLQCLVYDKESISDQTLQEILRKNEEHWHMVLLVQEDVLILNRNVPLSENFVPSSEDFGPQEMPQLPPEVLEKMREETDIDTDPDIISLDNGLFWFLITISASIPDPLSVNTVDSLNAIAGGARFQSGASTHFEDRSG